MSSSTFDPVVGQNQYLQLFAAQLQHQDPLEPTKQEDFLAQLAQFSSVESLQNMNAQFSGLSSKLDTLIGVTQGNNNSSLSALQTLNAGAGLLGKSVRYGSDSSSVGVVDQIKPENGSILVRIGDQFVPIASIVSVAEKSGNLNL
jgi:flagellar basal-body rod modification protein FlgD